MVSEALRACCGLDKRGWYTALRLEVRKSGERQRQEGVQARVTGACMAERPWIHDATRLAKETGWEGGSRLQGVVFSPARTRPTE